MNETTISTRTRQIHEVLAPLYRFFTDFGYMRRRGEEGVKDFAFGNPQEPPLPGFVTALQQWSLPRNKDWFAYKNNEAGAQEVVARSLQERYALPFRSEDIFLTNGAFAALAVALATIVDPGDEIIFISPPWFFYESIILGSGARPVRVPVDPASFDLDLAAIEGAISERTRGIIVNSPNNPTGKIYPPETLQQLADLLSESSERIGRPIYLLSDDAYSRLIFDGRSYHSPATFYPYSFMIYTYGKTLLTPGQRLGYIALPPNMPEREPLREAIFLAQFVSGYAFPNALLQHALPDLEQLSIDVAHLQRKRDRLGGALREMGYEFQLPEGTFYLLVRSPLADDLAFAERLATHGVLCLPGTIVELPGYFRLSLTASDEMIEAALPGFAAAIEETREANDQF